MAPEYEFDLYVHIRGTVEADSGDELALLDAIMPDGCEGEIMGVTTNPQFYTNGYIKMVRDDEEDEEE